LIDLPIQAAGQLDARREALKRGASLVPAVAAFGGMLANC
jgi:hypothetical protein